MKLARASRLHEDRAQIPGCTPDDRRKDAIVGSFPQKGPVQAPRTHADRPLCADLRDPRMDIRIYGIDDIQYTDETDQQDQPPCKQLNLRAALRSCLSVSS